MAHGYLGDGYGAHGDIDPDREDDRDRGWRGEDRRAGEPGMFRDWDRERSSERRSLSANPDDHYLSWRDRHMSELDRDYADYCRERELQFHQHFDAWRNQRHGNPGPLQPGMTQTGISHEPTGELELDDPATMGQFEEDPMATATLGTTSGRSKRR